MGTPLPRCPIHGASYTQEISGDSHRQLCSDCDWTSPVFLEFRFPNGDIQWFQQKESFDETKTWIG